MTDEAEKGAGILEAMKGIELLVAELYGRFAEAFPEDGELWRELVREEEGHAATVAGLKDMIGRCEGRVAEPRAKLAALATYRKGLMGQLDRVLKGGLGRAAALFIARDLEKTLIEREFYGIVACDDPEFRAARDRIQDETRAHFGKLDAYIGTLGLR